MVRSYELGVLITDPARVKLPYDYPIAKYGPKDDPWICDMSYTEADSHGKQWIISRLLVTDVAIVGAASCELLRYAGDETIIREIFTSLDFFDKEKVGLQMFPTNCVISYFFHVIFFSKVSFEQH
ncbi:hypothetical protein ANCDUO_25017 [Ancylostoma duodenale]|uniref:Uncharacterized protein n=1 Tax=Ancylostoma duodenale TaxID=51022 RepID=A0A0C2BMD3_9BILA|nr:hypothetical protein ANCDUO_25017 [Ancylostoma duodenale]